MPYNSPYAGMMNAPNIYTDPDGECPICPILPGLFKLAAALKGATVLSTVTVTAAKVSAIATAAKVTAVAGAAYVGGTAAMGGFNPMTYDIAPRHLMQGGDFYGKNFYNGQSLHYQQPQIPEVANLQPRGVPQPQLSPVDQAIRAPLPGKYEPSLLARGDIWIKKFAKGFADIFPPTSFISGVSAATTGSDLHGNEISGLETGLHLASAIPGGGFLKGAKFLKGSSNLWRVGTYRSLRGIEAGLDAHHVGQKALMKRFIPGYSASGAPVILVPKAGHTVGRGVVSRGTTGFTNARQVLARDIFELRRVYGPQGLPNSSLQKLIQMNRRMYPHAFVKPY